MDSGGSREGAQGAQAPLLFLDQTDEALMAEKNVFGDCSPRPPPHPYLSSGWLGPPYLKVWIRYCRTLNTIKFYKIYLWTHIQYDDFL